jgi:hypothetical protein
VVEVPETNFPAVQTIVSIIKTKVFIVETTVCGTKTPFSETEPIVYVSENGFLITDQRVGEVPTAFA